MCVSSFWCCCRISWFDVMPSFFFCHITVLRASSFCLGVSWYRIACDWMALIFSDSHLFAVCVLFLLVLLSIILLWLDTPFFLSYYRLACILFVFGDGRVSYCVRLDGIDLFGMWIVCSVCVWLSFGVGSEYFALICFSRSCFVIFQFSVHLVLCLVVSVHRLACYWMALVFLDS